jgi:hypothetical protein
MFSRVSFLDEGGPGAVHMYKLPQVDEFENDSGPPKLSLAVTVCDSATWTHVYVGVSGINRIPIEGKASVVEVTSGQSYLQIDCANLSACARDVHRGVVAAKDTLVGSDAAVTLGVTGPPCLSIACGASIQHVLPCVPIFAQLVRTPRDVTLVPLNRPVK